MAAATAATAMGWAAPPADAAQAGRFVDVVEVSGLLDPVLADFVIDAVADASAGAPGGPTEALLIQLDSSGTILDGDRLDALLDAVAEAPVPIGVWVGPSGAEATGDAARLLVAADIAGVSPGSRVDAPVGSAVGEEPPAAERLSADEAVAAGVVELASPTLGDFLVELDGRTVGGQRLDTAEVVETDDGPRREPTVTPRFSKLGLLSRLMHTVASPAVAYLLLVFGMALLLFELFTGGVGVAGVTGAGSLILSAYGLTVLPTNGWALGLVALAAFGFSVDIQTGVPRFWTGVAVVALVAASLGLYDGMSLSWLTLLAGLAGTILLLVNATPAVVRSRFSTPTIGRSWLIGELADAESAVDPEGSVRVSGALWRARTNRATPIAAGDRVRITGVEGVVLEVEPETGGARDYRERR